MQGHREDNPVSLAHQTLTGIGNQLGMRLIDRPGRLSFFGFAKQLVLVKPLLEDEVQTQDDE